MITFIFLMYLIGCVGAYKLFFAIDNTVETNQAIFKTENVTLTDYILLATLTLLSWFSIVVLLIIAFLMFKNKEVKNIFYKGN